MVVEESAYKTPVGTPTVWTTSTSYGLANAQAYYVRLDGGNAFTMRSRPVVVTTPFGGGVAVPAYSVSDKQELRGRLQMKLSVTQAPFWLSWAAQRINSGQTAPWTTTEPVGDLASCSIYHAIQRADGTYKRRLYQGCKVDSWSLDISEASTVGTLSLDISGSTAQGNQFDSSSDPTSGTFPSPADNYFPVDPFVFIHTSGLITIAGSARSQITELKVDSRNVLARSFFNDRWIQLLRWVGRTTHVATKLLYAASPDDRTAYEGLTPGAVSIGMNNGAHGFTMDLKAQNIMNPLEDDLPLDNLYFQSNTENNQWDPSAGADFALSFT